MVSPLVDLDELVLRCRDQKAKGFLSEAVACYRAGAMRASIVSTWIAVCFDIIEKLRELALAGDKEAEQQVKDLEKINEAGEIAKALKFERDLLLLIRDKFGLISHLEYIDLERLQADRNRCAHPSLVSDSQIYNPSAELARAHIFSAVTSVLQHPPAQGKFALERLLEEVKSEYFPTNLEKAVTALSFGPLKKPRDSLVRNFGIVLLKELVAGEVVGKARRRLVVALLVLQRMHPQHYAALMTEKLSVSLRNLKDNELKKAIALLEGLPDVWQYLHSDVSQKLQNYVAFLPSEDVDYLEFLLKFEPLSAVAMARVGKMKRAEIVNASFFDLPASIASKAIDLLLNSRSVAQAGDIINWLDNFSMDLEPAHVERIIKEAHKNEYILVAPDFRVLLSSLRQEETIPKDIFDGLLASGKLTKYAGKAVLED